MNEAFLSFLWQFRLLSPELVTVTGESLNVLQPGEKNTDSGPDFLHARIRIGKTVWAGNVEIHVMSGDWLKHHHDRDPSYDTVILHVVYEDNLPVREKRIKAIPTLVVRDRIPPSVIENYHSLSLNKQWIPCFNQIKKVPETVFSFWSTALALERMSEKCMEIGRIYDQCGADWEETAYRWLSLTFGFRINSLGFEFLAKSLPVRTVMACSHRFSHLEALLFGQAGMLQGPVSGEYPLALKREYEFLAAKYNLIPMAAHHWKYLRLRPRGFPTLRISQWAAILHKTKGSLFSLLEFDVIDDLIKVLNVTASSYWDDHFTFEKGSVTGVKSLGESSIEVFIISGVIPMMFFFADQRGLPAIKEKALHCLEQLSPEDNSIIRKWGEAGIGATDALRSQALLRLKRSYCEQIRCLECRIGKTILTQ